MQQLLVLLLLAGGVCETVCGHTLTCPYDPRHENLLRVWCRQTSSDCCSGLSFSHTDHTVDGGNLKVTQGSDSFTVEVLQLIHGGGVYWCGVLSPNNTIIKLAEGSFNSSSGAFIWSLCRWILLPLLPTVTTFTNLHVTSITKHISKKAEEPSDDAAVSRAPAEVLYENAASSCELE